MATLQARIRTYHSNEENRMPKAAQALKEEIQRLARKQVKAEVFFYE